MAKLNVIDNAVVITSTVKTEDWEKTAKFCPEALVLKDEDGNPIFKVGVGTGNANEYGVSFNGTARDGSGLATLTMGICGEAKTAEEVKEYLAEEYGTILVRLKEIEVGIPEVIRKADAQKAAILADITIG